MNFSGQEFYCMQYFLNVSKAGAESAAQIIQILSFGQLSILVQNIYFTTFSLGGRL